MPFSWHRFRPLKIPKKVFQKACKNIPLKEKKGRQQTHKFNTDFGEINWSVDFFLFKEGRKSLFKFKKALEKQQKKKEKKTHSTIKKIYFKCLDCMTIVNHHHHHHHQRFHSSLETDLNDCL